MSDIRVDNIKNEAGTGSPGFPYGASITGVATATSFVGNLTGNVTGNVTGNTSGSSGSCTGNAATATIATNAQGLTGSPNITVGTITASGTVSIGGTLTYEDVSNVDSVGLITARNGINVTAGVSTFAAATHQNAGTKVTGPYSANITAMGANDVDCSAGNYFTKTITGATTFTFSNAPTSVVYSFTMEVTLNGSTAITWPAAVKWNADTAPSLTDGKTQLFMFITDDGGTRWRGSALVDYVN